MAFIDFTEYDIDADEIYEKAKYDTSALTVDYNTNLAYCRKKEIFLYDRETTYEMEVGEQIFSFCELNLSKIYDEAAKILEQDPESEDEYYLPETKEQLEAAYDDILENTQKYLKPFADSHIYLELFPPIMIDSADISLQYYYFHLISIQNEFRHLLENCFDVDFYPEELLCVSAAKRFHIYTMSRDAMYPKLPRQEMVFDELYSFDRLNKATTYSRLECKNEVRAGTVEYIKNHTFDSMLMYFCASAYDALSVEFYQMIANDVKIRRCKRCGRFYTIKGKHDSDLCTRSWPTCQSIVAAETFKSKVNDNEIFAVFQKYYKRYHARSKVGTIKLDVFDKWNREACTKRDLCLDDKYDVAEFEQWCYDSFPNRKRKENEK